MNVTVKIIIRRAHTLDLKSLSARQLTYICVDFVSNFSKCREGLKCPKYDDAVVSFSSLFTPSTSKPHALKLTSVVSPPVSAQCVYVCVQ